ncbi:perforin-1-like [Clupea harengus]|uniref:Perforin-1-like n=1 Tax=Clupea harengus TaxID=7950 RepID=A0A6P3VZ37_CLUHA|nr:perforin-1-like [Clupea harengus]
MITHLGLDTEPSYSTRHSFYHALEPLSVLRVMATTCTSLPLGLLVLSLLCVATADVRVWGIRAYGLSGDAWSPPDPYVKVFCGNAFGGTTEFIKNNANPSWSAAFSFPHGRPGDALKLEVWDKDLMRDDHLGTCTTTVQNGSNSMSCSLRKGRVQFRYEL